MHIYQLSSTEWAARTVKNHMYLIYFHSLELANYTIYIFAYMKLKKNCI